MKKTVLLSAALAALLLPTLSFAQTACSGRFVITYPGGSSTLSNGTGADSKSFCPSGSSTTQQISVTPTSSSTIVLTRTLSNGQSMMTYNAGIVPGGTTYIFTVPTSSQTATYQLDGSTVDCNNAKTLNFALALTPSLVLRASATTVCRGTTTTLTADGASSGSYTLTAPGIASQTNTTGIFTVVPTTTTTYTVAATTTACGSTTQQVTVSVPETTVAPAAPTIAQGNSITLTASNAVGGATYNWQDLTNSTALGTGATQTVMPLATTTYRATSTAANCTTTKDVTVTVQNVQPLPVVLSSFAAVWGASGPALEWTTASERNNAYFGIERSLDGTTFAEVGRQAGAGTATAAHGYHFADAGGAGLGAGTLYYRLRQVDMDGTATYSPVRAVARPAGAGAFRAAAFPNPWVGELNVQLTTPTTEAVALVLYNALGQVCARHTVVGGDAQQVALPATAGLPRGVYFLRISQGNAGQVLRLVH